MNKREKFLGLVLLVSLLVIVHIYIGMKLKERRAQQNTELGELNTALKQYEMMETTSAMIKNEVDWINENAPPSTSFEDAQTALDQFLTDSSQRLGFSIYNPQYPSKEKSHIDGARYQRVSIQVSARATEKQIYQWLVKIHQPQKMRTLNYLKLRPPVNDSDLIECQIIAEQYIDSE